MLSSQFAALVRQQTSQGYGGWLDAVFFFPRSLAPVTTRRLDVSEPQLRAAIVGGLIDRFLSQLCRVLAAGKAPLSPAEISGPTVSELYVR